MTTNPYKQHVFTQDGTFTIAHTPIGGYFDAILVGGGGASGFYAWYLSGDVLLGANGGQVVYKRMYVNGPRSFLITVGAGGAQTLRSGSTGSPYLIPSDGGATSISDLVMAQGGTINVNDIGPYTNQNLNGYQGTLITDGLFSDNTTYYGGGGAHIGGGTTVGQPSVGGGGGIDFVVVAQPSNYSYAGRSGVPNTGGGAGASRGAGSYTPSVNIGNGGSGIVIIRYPIIV